MTSSAPDCRRSGLHPAWAPPIPFPPAAFGWRAGLPDLESPVVGVRELEVADATSLFRLLGGQEVSRFLPAPPASVDGFRKFIVWTHRRRAEGSYLCYGVVPPGARRAVGFFQLRALEADFRTAEWGFALGRPYWGTGIFQEAARLVMAFAFETLGTERLQARTAADNMRSQGALRKLGATRVAILPGAFEKDGTHQDEVVWSLRRSIRRRNGAMQ